MTTEWAPRNPTTTEWVCAWCSHPGSLFHQELKETNDPCYCTQRHCQCPHAWNIILEGWGQ